MARILCSDCKTKIKGDWNHCSQCGQKLERLERIEGQFKRTSYSSYIFGLLIAVLIFLPLVSILHEGNESLLSRLKNRGVLAWVEDKASDKYLSAGQYTPEQALMTATGSCRIWIYKDLKSADVARDNYINENVDFSASWSNVDKVTNTGVVLMSLEPKSYCSEEAASFLNWTLE
jgi:predicted nucleic acid-binding Zn ribbon protein